ncbi:MAG: S9 family peptidase [Gemmataceae bacterium]|nr:S9 family peptidase [Gemmataceae bacterium]
MRSLAIVLALLLPLVASAQDTFTPQHVAKLRIVTEAVISPDGTQVAYVLAVPRDLAKEKDGGSWTELHVVDTKGTSTPFITGQVNVGSIGWTPDGKDITFLTKREKDTTRCLYLIGAKGGESRKIVEHGTDIQGYSFSGDGKQVAFLATEPIAAAKKKLNDQGFNQEVYEEDQPFVRVWLASLPRKRGEDDAKTSPANAGGSPRMLKLDGSASELHFNPKEDKIAVALAPNPLIDEHIMFRKVHIVDLATGKATNLNNPGKLGQLAWSPDGKKLAMITGADKHDPKEGRVWTYTIGNAKMDKTITDQGNVWPYIHNGHVESIGWLDSEELISQEAIGIRSVTFWTHFSGPKEKGRRVFNHTSPEDTLVLGHISVAQNGENMAFVGQAASHPPEVFIDAKLAEKTKGLHRLTNSNPWLKNMKFAKQEVIRYNAKDGLQLEGVLIRPLNEEKGKRYPLVLHVHGGPEAHYSNGWITRYADLGQIAAARGMASFYPNYRGSTGYGVEFSMKGQKEAGGKEFDDLIDGVDHLIKMGLVDTQKVGITGGSYGGYATAWGSTYYSHRFAAGVMFVGISDWVSCSGTTDIPQEMFLVHHRKWLWDDWDYFKKASPIAHLDKAKTPLLIMHGKNDPRVNPGQSLEMYRHLKVRNQAPVRLVLYPGEGHGNRRAASRFDYNIRSLQWMEHYLKGPGGKMPAMEIDYGLPAPATKTSNAGWDTRTPQTVTAEPWLGRGCPCCIGW